MLHRQPHIQNHLLSAKTRLAARINLLTENGADADKIKKDNQVRQFKAQIRKAKKQLTAIEASETLTAEKAEARIRKEEAAKSAPTSKKSKKRDPNTPPAKKRKKTRIELAEDKQAA
jgi:hypothetical protein